MPHCLPEAAQALCRGILAQALHWRCTLGIYNRCVLPKISAPIEKASNQQCSHCRLHITAKHTRSSGTKMQLRTLITLHAAAATKTPERLPPDVRAREALKLVDSFGDCDAKTRRRAAYYALHPEQFWGDAHCEQVLDVVAKHCVNGLGLDIGANVGATLTDVRRCAGGDDCTGIIAFEPNPANLPLLREAADDDVIIVERAASDVADVTVAFNLPTGTDQVCSCCLSR